MMRAFWERDTAWKQALVASAAGLMIAIGVAWASDQGALTLPSRQEQANAWSPATIDDLSPGNRLIAEALFAAQAPDDGERKNWTLTRIAASRNGGQSWGEVFQQMKSDNLLRAETLGQVVIWYQYNYLKSEPYIAHAPMGPTPASERN